MNYDKLSKEITEYQNKVKINREADVLDFTVKNKKLNFTSKSLAKNSTDLNPMEKAINEVLVKNNYMTDDKILEKENNINIDPNEVAKRYAELKKIKHLLFQKELKSKRVAKIKSKLYHKIKKKQSDREEIKILSQLQEIDPSGVKEYIEKKKLDRIKERLSLKHSLNSKFAKTVKKYNLHKDQNTK
jgi:U3 small nucleolar RNA-associated protein 14